MTAININQKQFQQMMNDDKPVLVNFGLPGAAVAAGFASVDEQFADEYDDLFCSRKG